MQKLIWNDASTLPNIPRGDDQYFWAAFKSNTYDVSYLTTADGRPYCNYVLTGSKIIVRRVEFVNAELTDDEREYAEENGELEHGGMLDHFFNEDGEHIDKTGFYDMEFGGDGGLMDFFETGDHGYPCHRYYRTPYIDGSIPDTLIMLSWAEYQVPDAPEWLSADIVNPVREDSTNS